MTKVQLLIMQQEDAAVTTGIHVDNNSLLVYTQPKKVQQVDYAQAWVHTNLSLEWEQVLDNRTQHLGKILG